MNIHNSLTSAQAYAELVHSGVINNLHSAIEQVLIHNGSSMAPADIFLEVSLALGKDIDGRNYTRLSELWREGRIRKNGIGVSNRTHKTCELWESVPDSPALRRQAKLEYWKDRLGQLQDYSSGKLQQDIATAESQIEILTHLNSSNTAVAGA